MQGRFKSVVALLLLAVIFTIVAAEAATITPRAIRVPVKRAPVQRAPMQAVIPSHLVFTAFAPFQSGGLVLLALL